MRVVPRRFSVDANIDQCSLNFRRGAKFVDQHFEVMVFAPAAGGGVQSADLFVGRGNPIRVDRSRVGVQEHVASEVRHVIVEHSERTDELLPCVVPCEYIVGGASDERRCCAKPVEKRQHRRRDGAGQGARGGAQLRCLADHRKRVQLSALSVDEA